MFYLGIGLILYAVLVFWITVSKPEKLWNTGKIRGFVKILGEGGTKIFFIVIGLAALGFGIWLLIEHWPA